METSDTHCFICLPFRFSEKAIALPAVVKVKDAEKEKEKDVVDAYGDRGRRAPRGHSHVRVAMHRMHAHASKYLDEEYRTRSST